MEFETRKSKRIALLMERLVGFNHDVLEGVREYAIPSRGWVCHFINPQTELLPLVARWEPHGIIAFLSTPEFAQAVHSLRVPVVDVAAWVDGASWPRVGLDDVAIGRLGATHLMGLGFEHFGFVGNVKLAFAAARSSGFAQELGSAGYTTASFLADPERFPPARRWTMGGVDRELVAWIAALPKPVSIFADNDERALLVSEACEVAGIDVPNQVAILGVDDDPYLCELGYPSLSSVATPTRKLGYEAAKLLDLLLGGVRQPGDPILLPPCGVVERRSTDFVAFGDPVVAQAMRFIRASAFTKIGVDDVVEDVLVGRRTLERRFQKVVGRSVFHEIQRYRLDRARFLMATTDLPLKAIARDSGFSSISWLSTSHRQVFGTKPSEYRRRAVVEMRREIGTNTPMANRPGGVKNS